ncbi:MAG: cell division protein FtsQ/DivIB [Pseudomonadota bacterium]
MAAVYAKRPGRPLAERIAAWPWAAMARHTLHLLALAGMVAAVLWGWRAIHDPWNFPLRVVKVDGQLQHLPPQAVQTAVDERLQGSFFGVDLAHVLRGLTDLAWIRDARVRREWPDKLHLWVEEHKPLALWRGDAVLTADGALIYPEGKREADPLLMQLPALSGGDGREMALWNEFNRLQALLAPTGLRVAALREDQRGSQTLVLQHGLTLRLGREDVDRRLQRFLAAFDKTLAQRIAEVEEVDLRYANGFSVKMRAVEKVSVSGRQELGVWMEKFSMGFAGKSYGQKIG